MATHSSILAWEIPWTEELGRLQSTGSQKSWTQLNDGTTTFVECLLSSTMLDSLHLLFCSILLRILWDKAFYCAFFIYVETEGDNEMIIHSSLSDED